MQSPQLHGRGQGGDGLAREVGAGDAVLDRKPKETAVKIKIDIRCSTERCVLSRGFSGHSRSLRSFGSACPSEASSQQWRAEPRRSMKRLQKRFELRGPRARDKSPPARTRRREGGTRCLRQTLGGTHGLDHAHDRRSLRRHGNHRLRVGGNLSPIKRGSAAAAPCTQFEPALSRTRPLHRGRSVSGVGFFFPGHGFLGRFRFSGSAC